MMTRGVAFSIFETLYPASIGLVLLSYFKMRERANRKLPKDKQLPISASNRGFFDPLATYAVVAEAYRREFPNSALPKICVWGFLCTIVSFIGLLVSAALGP